MTMQDPRIIPHDARPTAVLRRSVTMADLGAFYDTAYRTVGQTLGQQGVEPAGPAFGYYLSVPTDRFELEAGFPTAAPITPDGDVLASELPAGEVARAVHVGAYDSLGDSWDALTTWVAEQGRTPQGPLWEVYVTQPTPETDPATLRTKLYLLLAE